LRVFSSF